MPIWLSRLVIWRLLVSPVVFPQDSLSDQRAASFPVLLINPTWVIKLEMGRWSLVKVLRLFPDCCSEKVQSLKVRPYQWNRMVICSYSSNKHPNESHNWLISVPTQNEKFSLKQLCLHSKNNSPHMKVFMFTLWHNSPGENRPVASFQVPLLNQLSGSIQWISFLWTPQS